MVDIGTGDGRFVSASARAEPNKFFIGIDANVKPLEKPSMKATRKPAKGGLPNLMFVQAAAEALPSEFDTIADEIHIHFPWGSLLKGVAVGDPAIIDSLRRIAAPGCILEIVIGIDSERDKTEIGRLGIPALSDEYFRAHLIPKYETRGFELVKRGTLTSAVWSRLETSWARKLSGGSGREAIFLILKAC